MEISESQPGYSIADGITPDPPLTPKGETWTVSLFDNCKV
jgi:hypothetical protein